MSEEPEQQPLTGDQPTGGSQPEPETPGEGPEGAPDAAEMPFEEAVEELETIVEELEEGELALEDAMERFERGLGLVEACRGKLERAELKVEELLDDGATEELEDG
jgi:exodeoxyribonuclease VII small subunit